MGLAWGKQASPDILKPGDQLPYRLGINCQADKPSNLLKQVGKAIPK
jgi:hypothetical protein